MKVFVTGGSRGIGKEVVKTLAHQGHQIAFTYSQSKASALEILNALPGSGHACYQMDLKNEESIQNTIEQMLKDFNGEIDGLVNNAGITKDNLLLRMKTEDFDSVINTNLRGTFLVTRFILKTMLKARKGSVVNITSVIGQTGNEGQANYAASKAGIEALTKSVAKEVASRNIRLNCIAPGFIETEMTGQLNDAQKEDIIAKIPLKRIGSSIDVAKAVAYLLSDDSNFITGHTLSINGGMFMN
jgi:3-oxoacyl-[acyl-carrier protein] reductase